MKVNTKQEKREKTIHLLIAWNEQLLTKLYPRNGLRESKESWCAGWLYVSTWLSCSTQLLSQMSI